MLSILSDDQRQAIEQNGAPLPIIDDLTNSTYMLMSVECTAASEQGGFIARIPGIAAYGEGETTQDASLALCEALRGYLETVIEG